MLKLGIVGAENSHSYQIGKVCNLRKAVPLRVAMLWGERPKFAKASAELGAIPTIVKDWREMVGAVDGVMIDHRHPEPHYAVAKFFLEQRVPCFVDKPFTYTLQQGKDLLALAQRKRVPICTFSALPTQPSFQKFKQAVAKSGRILTINSTGTADIKSKYGGLFFYGIHQVDAVIELVGADPRSVFVHRNGPNAVTSIAFKSGALATVNLLKEGRAFQWSVQTENDILVHARAADPDAYVTSARIIHRLLKTRKNPYSRERMLSTIAVLEAMEKSLRTGKRVKVAAF